jgi:D-alanyl-D-alanine carboxypeptidase/D-alanyl-D-alanine-endopeptidase (penicillin-binding protein 4)
VRGFSSTFAAALAASAFALLAPSAGAQPSAGAGAAGPDLPFSSRPSLAREASARPISAGKLERKLSKLARRAPGASGYYVKDLDAGAKAVLFDADEGKRRKLASNEKLFTTSTALSVLGADGRIETTVKAEGTVTDAGRLRGDIYLIGGGDPSFGAAGIGDLATDVKRAGIKRIGGRIVADPSVFDSRPGVPDSNYGPSEYIAPLRGLVYGGSTYDGDPALQAGQAFKEGLRDAGIKVGGKVKVDELPGKLKGTPEVGVYESETIASLAAATNKPSNNFYAEMLLKRLAATPKRQGTTRRGTKIVERFAHRLGSDVNAKDGSGLTNSNKSSPRDIVALLDAVRDEKGIGNAFVDSLAVAGKEGTLDDRMGGTVAAGRCRGKTGTIDGVSNLSGYCRSGKHMVAFSLLMNGVGDYEGARAIQDKMVVEIARYRP